jgi:multicomponent Na+:H+ antiporter subunit D
MSVLSPFLLALLTALLSGFARGRLLVAVNLGGGAAVLLSALWLLREVSAAGRISVALGNWPLPYAIEFAADGLSAVLVVLVALVALAVAMYQVAWRFSFPEPVEGHEKPLTEPVEGHEKPLTESVEGAASLTSTSSVSGTGLYPLQHGLVAASIAVCVAADLFNLYVWFELLLMALLGLLVLGGKTRHHEAAFKYFVLSMVGTLLMLAAVGLIHGATGHLNFTALREASHDPALAESMRVYVGLLFAALLLKAGAFPLFAWLPAAYHTLPAPLLALAGGLLTKITVYVLLRLSGQVFDAAFLLDALGWLAVITMLSGVLGAAYHWDVRRILAFHIVSQIGYLLLGVALASQAATVATSFFLLHNLLVKANLFLVAGLMFLHAGHYDLRRIGGFYPTHLMLAVLFLINASALVGVPPTSGFWGKYLLIAESFRQEHYIWGGIALLTGILTLYSMLKIWLEGFWKPFPESAEGSLSPSTMLRQCSARDSENARAEPVEAGFKLAYAAVIALTLVILWMGVYPDPVIAFLTHHSADFWSTP